MMLMWRRIMTEKVNLNICNVYLWNDDDGSGGDGDHDDDDNNNNIKRKL